MEVTGALASPTLRGSQALDTLLLQLTGPVGDFRVEDWLAHFGEWLRAEDTWPGEESDDPRTTRLANFIGAMDEVPAWRAAFVSRVGRPLWEADPTLLFADVGLPLEVGFWREAWNRFIERILPKPPEPHSLGALLAAALPYEEDAAWLERAPPELLQELFGILRTGAAGEREPLLLGARVALSVLAARVGALGLAPDVRTRLPEATLGDLPFLRLSDAASAYFSALERDEPNEVSRTRAELGERMRASVTALRRVRRHLERFGVSLDLVYRLELMSAQLARMESLLQLLEAPDAEALRTGAPRFLAQTLRSQRERHSLRALFRTSSALLARKVVEHTGRSGELYITETAREWRRLLLMALGGGAVTVAIGGLKLGLASLPLSLFVSGVAASVVYTGGFLLMQAFGFTLATKQPSVTGAALASALEPKAAQQKLEALLPLVARITRSQVAASIGNLGLAIPVGIAVAFVFAAATGRPLFDPVLAATKVASFHPGHSGTLLFAALTGVLLWAASLVSGWVENWIAYRRLPEAITASRRVRAVMGARRAAKLGEVVQRHAAGWGGNIALGVLLGMTPELGAFLGLPLDTRHMTLSAAGLALAAGSLGLPALLSPAFLWGLLGIALSGLLNFGISFLLAMFVALRARDVRRGELRALLWGATRAMFASPSAFFVPPRELPPAPVPASETGPQ